jgi:hypothetical protein
VGISNRARNWNKDKNFIFVGLKLQLCQLELPTSIYRLMSQSSLKITVSLVFCLFNRVGRWNEGKTIILIRSLFQFQIEIMVSYSRSRNVNVNMFFHNSNYEGKVSTYVFSKSFWYYRELKSECWASRHIFREKIFNFFLMCGGLNSCRKAKYIWSSHFPEVITSNMQIGNDFFVFKYSVTCKQKISKFTLILLKLM